MDLGFEVIRIHRYTNKRGIEQNTHPSTRNMYEEHKSETEINCSIKFYLIDLICLHVFHLLFYVFGLL